MEIDDFKMKIDWFLFIFFGWEGELREIEERENDEVDECL